MGLAVGLGAIGALGGAGLALVCLEEARKLRRMGRRLPAACFGLGAAAGAAAALGGAWLAWEIIDGFLL